MYYRGSAISFDCKIWAWRYIEGVWWPCITLTCSLQPYGVPHHILINISCVKFKEQGHFKARTKLFGSWDLLLLWPLYCLVVSGSGSNCWFQILGFTCMFQWLLYHFVWSSHWFWGVVWLCVSSGIGLFVVIGTAFVGIVFSLDLFACFLLSILGSLDLVFVSFTALLSLLFYLWLQWLHSDFSEDSGNQLMHILGSTRAV